MSTGALPVASAGDVATKADAQMTAERDETKYLVPALQVAEVVSVLSDALPVHTFRGRWANPRPDAQHFVTSVYFDTPSHRHYEAARQDTSDHVKVRAKEYYDVQLPDGAAVSEVWRQPWIWLELKRRQGTRTLKRRFPFPKSQTTVVFGRGPLALDALVDGARDVARANGQAEHLDAIEEFGAYCRGLTEPLLTNCLVNYRRLCWQDRDGSVRVTLDLGMACYAPPADLWADERPLLRDVLTDPRTPERRAVLEIKRRAPAPGWLNDLLGRLGLRPVRFSKYVVACDAVHGVGLGHPSPLKTKTEP